MHEAINQEKSTMCKEFHDLWMCLDVQGNL